MYREVVNFRLGANSSNYIQVGWQPIGFHPEFAEFIRTKKATYLYRVGWLRGAGEHAHLPIIAERFPREFKILNLQRIEEPRKRTVASPMRNPRNGVFLIYLNILGENKTILD